MDPNDLKGPVHNTANFSNMSSVKFSRNIDKGSKYVPIKESKKSIPIKSEFRSILIDYMHCHWIRQNFYDTATPKRSANKYSTSNPSKRPHLDQ